jgi:tRNA threonylcarbamoyladenosine dehydratase
MSIGIFERTSIILSQAQLDKLKSAHVLLAGLGGVGSYAAEALARAGIGNLTFIEHDVVSASNLNRQLVALNSTIDQKKSQVMKERVQDINPDCNVTIIDQFIRPEDMDLIFNKPYDYVIDAIDSLSCKVSFVKNAHEKGYKIISSMGAGGKIDPTKINVTDIYKTSACKLARVMRVRLKRQRVKKGILAVYSTEKPLPPLPPEPVGGEGRPRAVNGTISYLPSLFGLTAAGVAIQDIINTSID